MGDAMKDQIFQQLNASIWQKVMALHGIT